MHPNTFEKRFPFDFMVKKGPSSKLKKKSDNKIKGLNSLYIRRKYEVYIHSVITSLITWDD